MIEHWILRGPIRFRRDLFFAALFADFVAGSCRERFNTLLRHPEGRALARRLEGWPRALSPVADPSRLAQEGEHLRMTGEFLAAAVHQH
jgi:hypothetical protein